MPNLYGKSQTMHEISRRIFLKTSGVLMAGAMATRSFGAKLKSRQLSFSTLGCPDWSLEKIIEFAKAHGYRGIEVRGIRRELDLPKCPEFSSADRIAVVMRQMKEKGLRFVGLGSSATLHFPEGQERQKHLDDGKRFIELSAKLECPYVRVFPNNFPKDQAKEEVIDRIVKGLDVLGNHAKGSGVVVLMETHGDVVWANDIELIMTRAGSKQVGLVWDISNMWTVTKEPVANVYHRLKKYIHHTHLKDAILVDGKPKYCLLGRGEVPIFEAIDLLDRNSYDGFYSFEWEKMWHPDLPEPEIAFADFPKAMKRHFSGK